MQIVDKYGEKDLHHLEVQSSHYFRQCHPETCCCSGESILVAVYRKGCDHSTDSERFVAEGRNEDMIELAEQLGAK